MISKGMDNYIADTKNGTKDLTVDGKCSCCSGCCSWYWMLTEEEFHRHKKHWKHEYDERFVDHINNNNNTLYLLCPFLDDKKCVIYGMKDDSVRGEICKQFICNEELPIGIYEDKTRFAFELYHPHIVEYLTEVLKKLHPELYMYHMTLKKKRSDFRKKRFKRGK